MTWKKHFVNIFIGLFLLSITTNYSLANENDDFDEEFGDEQHEKEKYIAPHYESPKIDPKKVHFLELFDDKKSIGKTWFKSESKKEDVDEAISKYDGEWSIGSPSKVLIEGDYALILLTKARHHAIATKLSKPFKFENNKPLVVQYEVKYEEGQECGGGYIKLLEMEAANNLRLFNDKTGYVIMFGPDKCGMSSKIHLILRHKNPKNGTITEHHAKQPSTSVTEYFDDKKTHLYTLVINSDNTYHVYVDQKELMTGNILTDLEPPMLPPKQIPDPDDKKPADWDDRVMIEDSEAKKPDDWDESQPKEVLDEEASKPADWLEEEESLIPDPKAEKPKDWDDEMDGEWEPRKLPNPKCEGRSGCGKWTRPMKANPLYKGKWSPPRISNPNYKGPWTARLIDNPNYFEQIKLQPIGAIGIELWTMSSGIVFDNIIVTDDENTAKSLAKQTFEIKKTQEKVEQSVNDSKQGFLKAFMDTTQEKPWLWAVIILGVLIPIILISIFCFGRKSSKRDHPKKTDELVEDEDIVEMEEPEREEEVADGEEDNAPEVEEDDGAELIDKRSSQSASSSATNSKPSTPKLKKKQDVLPQLGSEEAASSSASAPESTSRARRVRVRRQD